MLRLDVGGVEGRLMLFELDANFIIVIEIVNLNVLDVLLQWSRVEDKKSLSRTLDAHIVVTLGDVANEFLDAIRVFVLLDANRPHDGVRDGRERHRELDLARWREVGRHEVERGERKAAFE